MIITNPKQSYEKENYSRRLNSKLVLNSLTVLTIWTITIQWFKLNWSNTLTNLTLLWLNALNRIDSGNFVTREIFLLLYYKSLRYLTKISTILWVISIQPYFLIKCQNALLDRFHYFGGLVFFVLGFPEAASTLLQRPGVHLRSGSERALQDQLLRAVFPATAGPRHVGVTAIRGGWRHLP